MVDGGRSVDAEGQYGVIDAHPGAYASRRVTLVSSLPTNLGGRAASDVEDTKVMTSPTYRKRMSDCWNLDRRGIVELDAVARAFLGDGDITDRDRIAFALRELRRRGYDVEARPVDWSKAQMICSLEDSLWTAFGPPQPSRRYARLRRIGKRTKLVGDETARERLFYELYDENKLWNTNTCDCLADPYQFTFKGDAQLVDSVFQAVGFATQLGISVPDDGSESHHVIQVAPPTMFPLLRGTPGRP